MTYLKIGELAKHCGLTVRTLHHYDAIGLLSPSVRDPSDVRLYGKDDLIRLHRILALKALGYSLSDIRANLDDARTEPMDIIDRQMQVLDQQIHQATELRKRLQHLSAHLSRGSETVVSDWLNLLEMMTMYQKHLTPQEMQALRKPLGAGAADIAAQWTQLVGEVDAAMHQHLPTDSPRAHALAWRWVKLVIAMTGNDPVLAAKLKAMQESEPRAQEILRIDPAKFEWIAEAIVHARTALFAKYLTPDETEELRRRQLAYGEEWPKLTAQVRQQMLAGAISDGETVQALAVRWQQLFRDSYCGTNKTLEGKVRDALMREPDLMLGVGVDQALMAFVYKAMAHLHRPQHASKNAGPKPSAQAVAMLRATHQLLDSPLVLDDSLALRILGQTDANAVRANPSQHDTPMSRGLRTSLVVRSRLAEDEWAMAWARGVRQCVILGAGLDTFAYRRTDPSGRVFEVDLPSTQAWKQASLRNAAIAVPESLTFVPVDFESTTLAKGLAAAGFRRDKPSFFMWLGVSMYLTDQGITETLQFIANCAAGTSVIFDYVVPVQSLPPMMRASIEYMMDFSARRGEPWLSFFEPATLEQRMSGMGFGEVHSHTPDELNQRYLSARTDGLHLGGLMRIMQASN